MVKRVSMGADLVTEQQHLKYEPASEGQYHYTVTQIYGEIIGDLSEEGSALVERRCAGSCVVVPRSKTEIYQSPNAENNCSLGHKSLDCECASALPPPPKNPHNGEVMK